MQLVDTSAGNSCHGNPQMQCLLLCFVSFWLIIEWGRNDTSAGGWKSAPWTVAGKVFNWGWNPLRVGLFFVCESCCDGNALLCAVVVPSERWRHLQHAIYMERSHHVSGDTCECTLFFSFITLTQVKMLCGSEDGAVAAAIQQAPRARYFHSFPGRNDRNLALWPLYLLRWTPVVLKAAIIPLFHCVFGQTRFKHDHPNTSTLDSCKENLFC